MGPDLEEKGRRGGRVGGIAAEGEPRGPEQGPSEHGDGRRWWDWNWNSARGVVVVLSSVAVVINVHHHSFLSEGSRCLGSAKFPRLFWASPYVNRRRRHFAGLKGAGHTTIEEVNAPPALLTALFETPPLKPSRDAVILKRL